MLSENSWIKIADDLAEKKQKRMSRDPTLCPPAQHSGYLWPAANEELGIFQKRSLTFESIRQHGIRVAYPQQVQ